MELGTRSSWKIEWDVYYMLHTLVSITFSKIDESSLIYGPRLYISSTGIGYNLIDFIENIVSYHRRLITS